MNYSATNEWSKLYGPNSQISYPAEGVIRIFKGSFTFNHQVVKK